MTVWMFYQQSRQQKQRQKMQAELKRGDRVYTSGGLIGTIRDIKDDRVVLEVAKEVRIEVLKSSVGGKYQQ
ncbi:MAG: preprotein translocase subunit YajC [Firmicutes bacterium]|nr:preprotein translocase subunit YajC [Alicyclobacillaceae bacterium]MCL6498184.1 preprotein translocase subunit YajC [Bacillota bacterium]